MIPKKQTNVLTVGMDGRKQAIFRMAFKMHTLQKYVLMDDVEEGEPDVAIVDMDGVDAEETWAAFRQAHPELPALLASTLPLTKPPAPVLTKPVRVESLFPLMRLVLSGDPTELEQPAAAAPALRVVTASDQEDEDDEPEAPARATPKYQMPATIERFDPGQGLLGALIAVREAGRASVIAVHGRDSLILVPAQARAVALVPLEQLQPVCVSESVEITTRPATPEDKPKDRTLRVQAMAAVIWQVALWSSRGRLPAGIGDNAAVRLRHWPNLTRLAPVPGALRIAAFLVRSPAPLRLIVRMLNVAPPHLFDFLSAAFSIGLLETTSHAKAEVIADPMQAEEGAGPAPEGQPRRGLLSRLLRKVVGI